MRSEHIYRVAYGTQGGTIYIGRSKTLALAAVVEHRGAPGGVSLEIDGREVGYTVEYDEATEHERVHVRTA